MPRKNQPRDLDSGPINPDGLISIVCDGVEVGKISERTPCEDRRAVAVVELRSPVLDFAHGNTKGLAGTVTRMMIAPEVIAWAEAVGASDTE